jgi:hypothetical protein
MCKAFLLLKLYGTVFCYACAMHFDLYNIIVYKMCGFLMAFAGRPERLREREGLLPLLSGKTCSKLVFFLFFFFVSLLEIYKYFCIFAKPRLVLGFTLHYGA